MSGLAFTGILRQTMEAASRDILFSRRACLVRLEWVRSRLSVFRSIIILKQRSVAKRIQQLLYSQLLLSRDLIFQVIIILLPIHLNYLRSILEGGQHYSKRPLEFHFMALLILTDLIV